jgi:hypothetical protein
MQAKLSRYKAFPMPGNGYRVWDTKHQRNVALFPLGRFTADEARDEAEEWAAQRNAGNDIAAPEADSHA